MSQLPFNSTLCLYMEQFIAFKKAQGYYYTTQEAHLHRFDQFLQMNNHNLKLLNIEIINAYIGHLAYLKPKSRANRLGSVREFSKYLHARIPKSIVRFDLPFKVPDSVRFYLYSNEEVCKLMNVALQLKSKDKLRPFCMCFLIGLLSCTGLRIDEALSLTRADVDPVNQRLFVKKGKFGKQRYVPLDESVVQKIQEWYELCGQFIAAHDSSPLLINEQMQKLTYSQIEYAFTWIRRECGLLIRGHKSPRLHDFRHTYACNCLLKWQAEGEVNTKLPILSTVLGHVDIKSTQVYLHICSVQLQQAAGRFLEFYTSKKGAVS